MYRGKIIDIPEAASMKNRGETYQTIADRFGTSRQAVQQIIDWHSRQLRDQRMKTYWEDIVFSGLYEYAITAGEAGISALADEIYGEQDDSRDTKLRHFLTGGRKTADLEAINTMIRVTGMPYERLFARRDV